MSKVKIAAHQPNLVPWMPFFYKMAMCDYFIILDEVQFEKNNYQNRFRFKDRWVTNPIRHGMDLIKDKVYTNGAPMLTLNMKWIEAIKDTLGIKARIVYQSDYYLSHSKTQNDPTLKLMSAIYGVVELDRAWRGRKLPAREPVYVTNPEAKDKYLDVGLMQRSGIEIEDCVVPRHLRKNLFELLEYMDLSSLIKQLPIKEFEVHPEKKRMEQIHKEIVDIAYEEGTARVS